MKHVVHIAFWLVAIAYMIGNALDILMMEPLTKPLLMPLLVLYFCLAANNGNKKLNRLIMLAGLFSWGGDVALMGKSTEPNLFLVGLVCFLIAHLCYIFAFKMQWPSANGLVKRKPLVVLPFVLVWLAMNYLLWPGLDIVLHIAVPIYSGILIGMALSALNRDVPTKSFQQVFGGALLFIISDGTLAINAFYAPFAMASLIVMGTYIVSQWLIFNGEL